MGQFGFHPLFASPEKPEYFEYRHMGENPFFRPLLVQAKFPAVDCESLTPTRGATQQSVGIKKKGKKVGGKMAFSGIPNKGEQKQKCSPTKGEQNQKWLPHPYLLGGPKEGGSAT